MFGNIKVVRVKGLEPPRLAAPEPKSGASTNSATPALSTPEASIWRYLAKLSPGCERENAIFSFIAIFFHLHAQIPENRR